MGSKTTVGERLKIARKAAGLTQGELGDWIGVGKSQISNIEKDTSVLTKSNAIVLSERIGISLDWLMTGEGEDPKPGHLYSNASISGNSFKSGSKGNEVTIGAASDLQTENEKLKLEIEYLKQRLKDKEEMIEILKKR